MFSASPYSPATAESLSRTIEALVARNVDAVVVVSREAALARLRELVPEGSEVFVNTSETLDTIGYTEYMHGNDRYINLHDQMMARPDPASQREFRRKTTTPTTSWAASRPSPRLVRLSSPAVPAARSGPTPTVPAGSFSWPALRRSAPLWPRPRPAPAASHWSATTAGLKDGGRLPRPSANTW